MVVELPHPQLATAYASARAPGTRVTHLDSAAAGRSSAATIAAITAHLHQEAALGGYVAQAQATESIEAGRAELAALLGHESAELVFTESALGALTALLVALRLPAGSEAWVTPGEYGPNLATFAAFGLVTKVMPVADEVGHLDVAAVRAQLRRERPTFIHLCYLGSHRGVVQPAAELIAAAREHEVPVVVDAAQGIGHLDCRLGADAVYATSRKWLCGPRGVGMIAAKPGFVPGGVQRLESHEAYIAGRVGLANAVAEHVRLGPERVRERLWAIGSLTRSVLDGVGGWRVVEPVEEPSAITTLLPPPDWSDERTQAFRGGLVDQQRVVTTFAGVERAPGEARRAVLRVSPHLDVDTDQLRALAAVLERSPSGFDNS